jgi:phosphoribosyl-ATP pyrophosphohydrolase/phosphoribosyl-AMP cyclohydrolase
MNLEPDKLDWDKSGGLLPAVVQDADSGSVLMLGFMNEKALAHTLAHKRATFWSRSRNRLWEKGETSGNTLDVVSVHADCDGDTLLVRVRPRGPVCHLGTADCFPDAPALPAGFLATLAGVISKRAKAPAAESYTARLLGQGINRVAQKVGEEGVELALAAATGDRQAVIDESADLLYHLLVTLEGSGVTLSEVTACLASRQR